MSQADVAELQKFFFGILTSCSKRQNIIDHKHKTLQITV